MPFRNLWPRRREEHFLDRSPIRVRTDFMMRRRNNSDKRASSHFRLWSRVMCTQGGNVAAMPNRIPGQFWYFDDRLHPNFVDHRAPVFKKHPKMAHTYDGDAGPGPLKPFCSSIRSLSGKLPSDCVGKHGKGCAPTNAHPPHPASSAPPGGPLTIVPANTRERMCTDGSTTPHQASAKLHQGGGLIKNAR